LPHDSQVSLVSFLSVPVDTRQLLFQSNRFVAVSAR
jgi:hypothetical protein